MDELIKQKLEAAFSPDSLEVINESHLHAGHAGDDGSGQTHFRVIVVSPVFNGHSRLARHRLVNQALEGAFQSGLHALSIDAKEPSES